MLKKKSKASIALVSPPYSPDHPPLTVKGLYCRVAIRDNWKNIVY